MKLLLISSLALIAGVSCQIHTKIQADGYHYDRPAPEAQLIIAKKPLCPNGGSGAFCCINGADNVDCCDNGGRGAFCCANGANNPDCCENGGSGPYCCANGAKNQDCCENGGRGAFCCANGANNPDCCENNGSGPFCCANGADNADCCTNGGSGAYCCTNGAENENCQLPQPFQPAPVDPEPIQTLPPLPSFIPQINLPQVIPVRPTEKPQPEVDPEIDIRIDPVVEQPSPFVPQATTKSPNEYLPPLSDDVSEWDSWKSKFNKRYDSPEEESRRRIIFEENVQKIHLHNADFAAGLVAFDMDINKFADLAQDEFVRINTGIRRRGRSATQLPTRFYGAPYSSSARAGFNVELGFNQIEGRSSSSGGFGSNFGQPVPSADGFNSGSSSSSSDAAIAQGRNMMNVFMPSASLASEVKDEVDWRKEGAITPVKNQGNCASCWAFSANGALEAHNYLRKRTGPIPLSEQNLIDCVKENDGCDGGYMTNAYEYAARNPGVDTEASYPYEAHHNASCRFKRENVGGECMSHMEIQIGNEEALKQAVATVGPVAAGIDGGQRSFQFYKSGFYFEPKCDQEVNHAVLIVGYGTTESGEEYWICKNSWDTDWGEEGYIRMAKNRNNHCGITNLASYPIV